MNMKHRIYAIVLLLLLPIITLVRTRQLQTMIDSNGFYLPESTTLCNLLGYGLLGICLLFLLTGRFWLNRTATFTPSKRSISLAIGALGVFIFSMLQIPIDLADATTENELLLAIMPSALLGICFLVLAVFTYLGRRIPFWVTVLPIVTEFIRLIEEYAHFNGIAQISESIVSTLFSCSFLCFCLCQCRVFSDLDQQKGIGWVLGTASTTAIFGCLVSLPHLLAGQNQHTLSLLGLGTAIYAIIFLFNVESTDWQPCRAKHLKTKHNQ
jgi:hypothetical protein